MLPESLDELVGTYLDEIPHDPRTGSIMEYFPHGNNSLTPDDPSDYLFRLNHPHLKLEAAILDRQFLSGFD
jgi:hypothetical protein